MKYRAGTIFNPKKSLTYQRYILFTHLFALISVVIVTSLFLFPVFLLCFSISCLYYLSRPEKMITLQYDCDKEWILTLHNSEIVRAELLPSSVMMRYFLVLHFKYEHAPHSKNILLFSDQFSRTDFQALRRCVKMGYL